MFVSVSLAWLSISLSISISIYAPLYISLVARVKTEDATAPLCKEEKKTKDEYKPRITLHYVPYTSAAPSCGPTAHVCAHGPWTGVRWTDKRR